MLKEHKLKKLSEPRIFWIVRITRIDFDRGFSGLCGLRGLILTADFLDCADYAD